MPSNLVRLQEKTVHQLKLCTLYLSHQSELGLDFVSYLYADSEETSERGIFGRISKLTHDPKILEKLKLQAQQETLHASLFKKCVFSERNAFKGIFKKASTRSLGRIQKTLQQHHNSFKASKNGELVCLLALVRCLENMAVRIFDRHLQFLQSSRGQLLQKGQYIETLKIVLRDEQDHLKTVDGILENLVNPSEGPALKLLIQEIESEISRWAIAQSLGFLILSLVFWIFGTAKKAVV